MKQLPHDHGEPAKQQSKLFDDVTDPHTKSRLLVQEIRRIAEELDNASTRHISDDDWSQLSQALTEWSEPLLKLPTMPGSSINWQPNLVIYRRAQTILEKLQSVHAIEERRLFLEFVRNNF